MEIFVLHRHTQDLNEFAQTCTVPNCAFAGGGDLTTRYFWRSNDNTQFGSFVAKRPWVKRELAWEMLVVGVRGCRKVSEMKTCFLFQHNFVSKGVHILQCTHPIGATSTRCPLMLDHPKVQFFSEICSEFLWCVTSFAAREEVPLAGWSTPCCLVEERLWVSSCPWIRHWWSGDWVNSLDWGRRLQNVFGNRNHNSF